MNSLFVPRVLRNRRGGDARSRWPDGGRPRTGPKCQPRVELVEVNGALQAGPRRPPLVVVNGSYLRYEAAAATSYSTSRVAWYG